MKKILFSFILAIAFTNMSFAQGEKPNIKKPLPQLPVKPAEIEGWITDITVYPQPKQMGDPGYFRRGPDGNLIPPFPLLKSSSFTVAKGKIVYLKKCVGEFPTETAYTTTQSNINLTDICSIRSDDIGSIGVEFNGISTIIHNNDCKRFFGTVRIKVFELSPDETPARSDMAYTGTSNRGDAFTLLAYSNANANTTPRIPNYVFRGNPVPTLTNLITRGLFTVGRNALREGRVSVSITSDLGSAHKTCDLCDDFSSNIRMNAPENNVFPINSTYGNGQIVDASHNRVVLGPYQAYGSRDGFAITASGGSHIEFRVHLSVLGL